MIDYLTHNAIEMIVIGLAFCFSKSKMLPLFLICYITVMTVTFGKNQEYLENLSLLNPTWSVYNKELAMVYLFEGAIMLLIAASSMINISKLRAVTTLVIFTQSSVSIVMAVYCYGYAVEILPYINNVVDYHYSPQSLFVILYCVIAWMCVYYSRKGNQ